MPRLYSIIGSGKMPAGAMKREGSLPPFNYRGITFGAVGAALIAMGWIFPLGAPASDYVAFGGWALGAVGTVLHVRDNNASGDGIE